MNGLTLLHLIVTIISTELIFYWCAGMVISISPKTWITRTGRWFHWHRWGYTWCWTPFVIGDKIKKGNIHEDL